MRFNVSTTFVKKNNSSDHAICKLAFCALKITG